MSCHYCKRNLRVDAMKLENKDWCGGCEKGVVYISYPFGKEHNYTNEFVPSYPPWTTFNGVMLCKEDSEEASILKTMDRNFDKGFYFDKTGEKIVMEGFIRGLWTSSKINKVN